jgi:hypothetical protein
LIVRLLVGMRRVIPEELEGDCRVGQPTEFPAG